MRLGWLAAAAAMVCAVPANAVGLLFKFAPTDLTLKAFTFTIDDHPAVLPRQSTFDFQAIAQELTIDGVAQSGAVTVTFYTQDFEGGLTVPNVADYGGPQLFTGTTLAPLLLTGVYNLNRGTPAGVLTVTTVPEPASWALMILGVGAVGAVTRRRAKIMRTQAS